jgi:hypothetical protein
MIFSCRLQCNSFPLCLFDVSPETAVPVNDVYCSLLNKWKVESGTAQHHIKTKMTAAVKDVEVIKKNI